MGLSYDRKSSNLVFIRIAIVLFILVKKSTKEIQFMTTLFSELECPSQCLSMLLTHTLVQSGRLYRQVASRLEGVLLNHCLYK